MGLLRRLFSSAPAAADDPPARIEVDDDGVRRLAGDRLIEGLAWDELAEVEVVTTDEGPFAEDVFLVLGAGDHGVVVPQGAPGADAVLDRLQALPGFDNDAFIEAMASTANARWPVWRRP